MSANYKVVEEEWIRDRRRIDLIDYNELLVSLLFVAGTTMTLM